ncbi:MAG: LamG domain-containing protein [Saprospiraceae bacterium]|nr:LamG domain-containing protein [Saprospiraceae bacterium]
MRHFNSIVLALFAGAVFNFPPPGNPDEGLIAYYSFNECDARDDSGNGSDGVLFGGVQCWCGIDDDGLLFDGTNDYLEFQGPVNDYFTITDFTISFYFKSEQQGVFKQSMLGKRMECNEYQMFDLMLDAGTKEVDTRVHETPEKYFPGISPTYEGSGWQHFALVREGFRATTYINGQLKHAGFRCSGVNIENEALLSFSNSPCLRAGRAQRFKGVLDELRIYERALTKEEVSELYARFPIENAAQDCFTNVPQKPGKGFPHPQESDYLCARY